MNTFTFIDLFCGCGGFSLGMERAGFKCRAAIDSNQEAGLDQISARELVTLPVDIIGVGDDLALARQAAIFKATHKMSYADCFAAALAKMRNAELVTGDPEFKGLEKEIKVNWLT